ncbi:MAG: M15 family metallopeptidase [Microthrixaceae bacterium]
MRRRTLAVLMAFLTAASAMLSACDLPEQVAGTPCQTEGDLAKDATHVLACTADLRWTTFITLERADLIMTRLAANEPTPASPAPVEATTGCSISRRYAADAASLPIEQRKHRAIITALGSTRRGCGCLIAREWSIGMEPEAVASLRNAMDQKEALMVAMNPAASIESRTIFVRAAWRSTAEQTCLRRALGRAAEEPGKSFHEFGVAIDLEDWEPRYGDFDRRILQANGWCRTYPAEGWHYEYRPLLEQWGHGSRCID